MMCSTRFWKFRIALCAAISLTLGSGQPIMQQVPEQRVASSHQEVQCRTARELAFALANPMVNVAVLVEDLTLTESEFMSAQQPGAFVLQRNFTIRGPETDRPTVLDMNFLRAKVLLNGSLTFSLQNLMLLNCRRGSATQQPGFDILTVTPDASGSVAIIAMRDCLIVYRWCFPPAIASKALEESLRPSEVPGRTSYILSYPSPYTCTNSSSTTVSQSAVLATPSVNISGLTWLPSGCFKNLILYADVAVYGGDMNDDGNPAYNSVKYPVHALNTIALCVDILPEDCVGRYGPLGCLTFVTKAQATPPSLNPPSPPPGSAVTSGVTTAVAASTEDASSDSKHKRTMVLTGSIIGGAALLVTAATFIIVLGRRWRWRWWQYGSPASTGAITNSTCSSDSTKSCAKRPLGCRHSVSSVELLSLRGPRLTSSGLILKEQPKAPGVESHTGQPEQQQQQQQQQLETVMVTMSAEGRDPFAAAAKVDGGNLAMPSNIAAAAAAPCADVWSATTPEGSGGGSGGGGEGADWCLGFMSAVELPAAAAAVVEDATLRPVTPLTPLHPDINLEVQLDQEGSGNGNDLHLSGVTLGKGAFGRVVAGTYGGVPVAIKIIDQGLLYQWPTEAPRYNSKSGNSGENAASSNHDEDHVQGCGATTTVAPASSKAAADGSVCASLAVDPEKGSPPSRSALGVAPLPLLPPLPVLGDGGGTDGGRATQVIGRWGVPSTGKTRVSGLRADVALPQEAEDRCAGCDGEPNGAHDYGSDAAAAGAAAPTPALATGPAATLAPSSSPKAADVAVPVPTTATVAVRATAAFRVANCRPAMCSLSQSTVSASLVSQTLFASTACAGPEGNTGGGSEDLTLTHQRHHHHHCHGAWRLNELRDATGLGTPPLAATATAAHEDAGAPSAQAPLPPAPNAPKLELALKQEVEVLSRCRHPNIVRLLAASLQPPRFCLVMELMDSSLDRLLYSNNNNGAQQSKLLPLDTVLHIAIQIAKGLAYLHPTIVHRDLKPGNVLISHSDAPGRPIVKLADFGLSRVRSTVLVTEHPEVGTAPYIAPEAFDIFNKRITDRLDVYALGIILWEMLAGRQPWAGLSIVVIALSVYMHQQRPPLVAMRRDRCPPKLRLLIESCWEQIPERRPAAAEVVKSLILIQQQVNRSNTLATGVESTPLHPPQ